MVIVGCSWLNSESSGERTPKIKITRYNNFFMNLSSYYMKFSAHAELYSFECMYLYIFMSHYLFCEHFSSKVV